MVFNDVRVRYFHLFFNSTNFKSAHSNYVLILIASLTVDWLIRNITAEFIKQSIYLLMVS